MPQGVILRQKGKFQKPAKFARTAMKKENPNRGYGISV